MDRYKVVYINGVRKKEHHAVWEAAHGPIPQGHVIHHINGNGHDNRLENLMLLSKSDHIRLHKSLKSEGIDPVHNDLPGVADDRARAKRYYENNKDVAIEKCRIYRKTHKEETLAAAREYRFAHREEIAAYQKKYGEAHKAEKAEYDRKYREKHREELKQKREVYFREYRETHKAERHERYIANREEILRKQKAQRDANRVVVRIKDRLWRAIRLKRPPETIESIRKELELAQSEQS